MLMVVMVTHLQYNRSTAIEGEMGHLWNAGLSNYEGKIFLCG